MQNFFLTTPIYYVNARPHIGHAYTTIVADVLARRARAQGLETFFLTGTDEHGQKIERSAAAAGVPPQQFADEVSAAFSTLWQRMGITHDDFIRTTSARHKRGVQKLFATLYERGFIYLSTYTGAYCVSDEAFVDLPAGTPCPDCGRPLETVTEENFFFKLSAFQQPLLDLIESGNLVIQPESARNEVLAFIRGGLKDLSVSRSSFTWGVPVPEPAASTVTQKHVIYVWLDALANYMTALGYGAGPDGSDGPLFQKFWPADLHLVGKEITRFHCVYWPAFLMAAGIATPRQITANGWLLFDNSKMSKSKGNIVRTETILDAFGTLCPPPPTGDGGTPQTPGTALSPTENVFADENRKGTPSPDDDNRKGTPSPDDDNRKGTPSPDDDHRKGTPSGVPQAPHLESLLGPSGAPKHHQDLFAADILRYFLLREIPFGQDGTFSFEALITRYNADLANGYGNLVSRTLNLIGQSCGGTIPAPKPFERRSFVMEDSYPPSFFAGTPNVHTIEGPLLAEQAAVLQIIYQRAFKELLFTSQVSETTGQVTKGGVINAVLSLVAATDGFITQKAPWKLAKSSDAAAQSDLHDTLYTAAESIRIITLLLHPILPYATAKVWAQLGLDPALLTTENRELRTTLPELSTTWGGLQPGTPLGPLSPIFPRADKGLAQIMIDMESPKPAASEPIDCITGPNDPPNASAPSLPTSTAPSAAPRTTTLPEPNPGAHVAASAAITTERPGTPSHTEAHASGIFAGVPAQAQPADQSPQITIDDFAKVELRVAQILIAERIPKADKLLRLEVDLGFEKRQILSGIAEWYTPEELVGRRIVVITNLAPRKMRGLESHGMLLAASGPIGDDGTGGKPHLATFIDSETLPLGSRLK